MLILAATILLTDYSWSKGYANWLEWGEIAILYQLFFWKYEWITDKTIVKYLISLLYGPFALLYMITYPIYKNLE
jgi:hypothetical protein